MKRRLLIIASIIFLSTITVYANNSFKINLTKLFNEESKAKSLQSTFNSDYTVSSQNYEIEDEDKIREVTKMATYYLLGPANNIDETADSYINRKNMFYDMRHAPKIPRDSDGNLDKTSQEYKDDMYTGYKIPTYFLGFQNYDFIYKEFGTIQVFELDDGDEKASIITIPNIKMKVASEDNPMEFVDLTTTLTIRYIFKKLDGEYKIYYIDAEYNDPYLDNYFDNQMNNEYEGTMSANIGYKPRDTDMYDYSKLDKLSKTAIENIYNDNLSNIIVLNTLYNNSPVHIATGFIINKGIAITTWTYLDKSLREGQDIIVKDGNGKIINLDGIISIDIDNDLAILKISGDTSNGVKIGDTSKLKANDPVIVVSTKTGIGLSIQKGIVMSTKPALTNVIPLLVSEEGSPVFNQNGEVVGINTSELINFSSSKANSVVPIKELQDKFKTMKVSDISFKTFAELKENYYSKYNNDKIINTINSKTWKKYKKIGDIENTVKLELVKANYKNDIVSLRYKNNISSVFSNMQFASEFITNLKNNGYSEITNDEYKKTYTNNKYRITIMSEFDYLIIVMSEI